VADNVDKEGLDSFVDRLDENEASAKLKEHAENITRIKELQEKMAEGLKLTVKEQKELNGLYSELGPILRELEGSMNQFENALERSIKTFTGVTTSSNTLIGSFARLVAEEGDLEKATKKTAATFKKTFSSLNVGISIMEKVVQSTIAMAVANDQALASFNKTTGAAGFYNRELLSLERGNRRLGISTAEMGESYSALMSGLSGFGTMAQSERERLGELGAQYAKTGISASDFAGSVETMTRGFGMSTQAATGMVEESRQLAQALGRDVGSVISELNQTLPQLASYGADATDEFLDLERQAQRTGLAVGELIDIAGQYRTFDSAASAAGNLNAVLGTQLFSTMGLLEAQLEGPDAVIEYMSENLANSIGDWDSLNTFQKEATANAANMSVEQMNNLMNQRNMTQEERDRITTQEEAMKTARSMGEELKILFAEFAVSAQPFFEILKSVVGFFSTIMQVLGKLGNGFAQITALALAYFGMKIAKEKLINGILRERGSILRQNQSYGTPGGQIGPARPPTQGGITGMSGGAKMAYGIGALASIGGGLLSAQSEEEGDLADRAGGALSGAATGAMIGSMFGPGYGTAIGGVLGGIGGALGLFADGTDSTPRGPAIVGEEGPELLVPPPGSAVVNNSSMTALANGAGGGNNTAVVAAVQALGSKLDSVVASLNASGDFVMQVDDREFGRVINKHLGEPGYQKIDLRTA